MPGNASAKLLARRSRSKRYDIDQSHLFRVGSPARLSMVLGVSLDKLLALSRRTDNYKLFQKEDVDPFARHHRRRRDIQEPKAALKKIHERVAKLLKFVRVPTYLHSAIKGVSYRTNALEHAERGVSILTMDIADFYPSTGASRVFNFFRDVLECAPDVSKLMAKLLTWRGVLATGSPASPLLSFHCNRPMFDEMAAVAVKSEFTFTCYVDDVTFSGVNVRRGLVSEIACIARRHGHRIKEHKTRFYSAGQAGIVTGVVVEDGSVSVPHERRLKGRRIETAIDGATDPVERLALTEKLMGLAGEAAYLDKAFRPWVDSIRGKLKVLRRSYASRR
ncbi:reverse transcriptase family protein [Burkholderia pseudomallei]|uniref:reverse transcriptase family protein n=3 Tax=Burkholderia pseudomallei TaxID=28450 RepID=UPI000413E87F|nr:reverse transcriptase family protein [Burkholderia pseudomallei]KGW96502.1 reverse transcriptase family protein [Burkholderia pseudomallei MSHR332]AIP52288.1 reverse transcriptase family protein [Burkholderia pseudomallei HBPUB10134a]AYX08843.1 RNA-directed DNA polymerase [Burkholderia pseudomallei]KGW06501.1 reverse transcriptase family protein [Burkholderia pseudomallei MSHR4303]MBF3550575.1 RNA-directed DNA polymerase [Burkholderia pseudomallei]